ncbi:hypothetical protein JCM18904_1224 [Vibrio sp. JCM 18904]|nr:hypothetical protein JCM18904_1224 [Vibrio sp. JCM 18904]
MVGNCGFICLGLLLALSTPYIIDAFFVPALSSSQLHMRMSGTTPNITLPSAYLNSLNKTILS